LKNNGKKLKNPNLWLLWLNMSKVKMMWLILLIKMILGCSNLGGLGYFKSSRQFKSILGSNLTIEEVLFFLVQKGPFFD
jgi:hypothetical protein